VAFDHYGVIVDRYIGIMGVLSIRVGAMTHAALEKHKQQVDAVPSAP